MSTPPLRERSRDVWRGEYFKWSDRLGSWLVPVATFGSGVGLTLTPYSWWWLAGGLIAGAIGAATEYGRHKWQDKEAKQIADAATQRLESAEREATRIYDDAVAKHSLMADQMNPIVRSAATMGDLGRADRKALLAKLVKQTLDAIVFVYGVPGMRAVIYEITSDALRLNVVDQAAHGYRKTANDFVAGTDRGDKALKLALSGEHLFVDDIHNAPEKWAGSGDGYNTFISAAITSSTTVQGLLTVDAVTTDDITEDIIPDVRLIAGVVAVLFASAR